MYDSTKKQLQKSSFSIKVKIGVDHPQDTKETIDISFTAEFVIHQEIWWKKVDMIKKRSLDIRQVPGSESKWHYYCGAPLNFASVLIF